MMGRVLTDGIRVGPQPEMCHQEGPFDGDVEPREGWMEAIRSHPTSPGEGKVKVHIRGDCAPLGTRPFPGAKPRKNKAVRAEAQSGQYCAMMGRVLTDGIRAGPQPEMCHQEGPFDGDVEPREGWMEAIRSHPTSPGEGKVKVHIRGDCAPLGTRPFPGAKPRKNKAVRAEAQSGQYCAMMGRVLTDGIRAGPQPEMCHQEGPFDGDVEPREGWMEAIRSHPTSPGEGKAEVFICADGCLAGMTHFGLSPRTKPCGLRPKADNIMISGTGPLQWYQSLIQPERVPERGPFDEDVEPRKGWMEAIRSHPTSPREGRGKEAIRSHPTSPGEGKVKVHIRGDRAPLGTRPFPGAKPRKNKAVRAEAQSGQYYAMMGRVLTDGIRAGPQPEMCHQEGPFDGDVEPREGWMEAIRSHPTSPGEGKVKVHIRGDRAPLGTRPFPGAKPRKNKAVRAEAQSGQYCAMMGRVLTLSTGN
ncbi:hypothetical protein F0562_024003 [Nyssa sinensis]|uniref:Uncharacterized protein n=1 Tax=Nyssa sinensis TaxID=561372 RepID=A0A5J5BNW8_9ASTE|nr:hypothetical protein F0562_024003 [Nyssa sinensis]